MKRDLGLFLLLILAAALCLLIGGAAQADPVTRGRRPRGVIARPVSIYAVVPVPLATQLAQAANAPLLAPPRQNLAGTVAVVEWRFGALTVAQRHAVRAVGSELTRRQMRNLEAADAAAWRR